jgi:hypothetical protein
VILHGMTEAQVAFRYALTGSRIRSGKPGFTYLPT